MHLDRLDGQDIEKLLVAIDLFYGGEKNIVALEGLAKDLKIAQRHQAQSELNIEARDLGLTYTELWEDELKRRFKAAAFMPLSPGLIMKGGSLTVVRQLALGGLSAVYLCQLDGKKLVVLKESVVPEDAKAELKDKAREMFAREAQLLMKINHPNIVRVLDFFVEGGRSYLMLDYVSGQDLRQYVKQNGRLREFQVIEWAQQIAAILAYLHTKSHRFCTAISPQIILWFAPINQSWQSTLAPPTNLSVMPPALLSASKLSLPPNNFAVRPASRVISMPSAAPYSIC